MKKLDIKKILILAFLIRFVFLPLIYHGDVQVTYWWGKFAVDFNLTGYYDWLNFGGYGRPDQPMINILYCKWIRHFYEFLYKALWFINIKIPPFPSTVMTWYEKHGNQTLLKLPMIFADLGIVYLSYFYFKSKKQLKKALQISSFLAIYPPLIYNSAIWGSGDSIVNLLGLVSLFLLINKKYFLSQLLLLLSIYYKPSLIMLGPLFAIIYIKNKPSIKNIIVTILTSLLFVHLISLPFYPKQYFPIFWNINIMTTKILPGCMHQLTSNAMNLWSLIYGLKPRLDEMQITPLTTARQFSFFLTLLIHLRLYFNLYKKYSNKRILLTWVNLSLVTFTFLTRMHERYTFPALIPLTILCFQDKSYLKYLTIITITHMLNVYNWWWWPQIQPLISFLKVNLVVRFISLVNICLTLSLIRLQLKLPKQQK